jgi:hypothetical protein
MGVACTNVRFVWGKCVFGVSANLSASSWIGCGQ